MWIFKFQILKSREVRCHGGAEQIYHHQAASPQSAPRSSQSRRHMHLRDFRCAQLRVLFRHDELRPGRKSALTPHSRPLHERKNQSNGKTLRRDPWRNGWAWGLKTNAGSQMI